MCHVHELLLAGVIGALIMCGMFISLNVLKFPDLTCEASYAMGSSIYCYLNVVAGISPIICIFVSMILGMICGSLTALLKLYLNIPKVISAMITVTASIGILQIFPAIDYAKIASLKFTSFTSVNMLVVIILTSTIAYGLFYFFISEIGLKFRAFSSSNNANIVLSLVAGLSASNGIIALAGAFSSQLCNTTSISYAGNGIFIFGITCLLISELIVYRKKYSFEKFFLTILAVGAILKSSLEFCEKIFNLNKNHAFAEVILTLAAIFIYSVLTSRPSLQMQLIKNNMND